MQISVRTFEQPRITEVTLECPKCHNKAIERKKSSGGLTLIGCSGCGSEHYVLSGPAPGPAREKPTGQPRTLVRL